MKKLIRLVTLILIISMLSTCVYATETEMYEGPQEAVNEQIAEIEEDEEEAESTDEVDINDADDITTVVTQETTDYIKDIKFAKAEQNEAGNVVLKFEWALVDETQKPDGYKVYINETSTEEKSLANPEKIDGSVTSADFDKLADGKALQKGKRYYIAIQPYTLQDDSEVDGVIKLCSGIYIDKPKVSKIKTGTNSATISFTHVTGASYYILKNNTLKEETKISSDKKSVTVKSLKENKKYSFCVTAVYDKSGLKQTAESASKSATTKIKKPGKTKLTLKPYNKGALLSWKKASNATSYEVWRYSGKKWKKIKTLKSCSYKNTGLTVNKKYKYRIRAVRKVNGKSAYGSYSKSKSITVRAYLTGDVKMGYSTGVLKRASKIYKAGSSTKLASSKKLGAGTRVTITKLKRVGGYKMAKVTTGSKNVYWIKYGNISLYAPYTTLDYPTCVKENFVNKKGYSSKTKYLVFISHYTQRTYIFKGKKGKWKQIHNYRVASGTAATRTPRGRYTVYAKRLYSPTSSAMYVTYFSKGGNSFHSRPGGSTTIGRPASHGCIRMYTPDAKFIYDNISKKTTVVSY